MNLPENINISLVLKKARQGLLIKGETKEKIKPFLHNSPAATGAKKIILLLEMLNLIATSGDLTLLSSSTFQNNYNKSETERLNDIYNYTKSNFKQKNFIGRNCLNRLVSVIFFAGILNRKP